MPSREEIAALPHAPALRHETEKWTKYLLDPCSIDALRRARVFSGVQRLGALADVDVGVVTGRNRFFVLRPSSVESRTLQSHVRPLVSKSAHVPGVRFSEADLALLRAADAPCHLLAVDQAVELTDDASLRMYVEAGEAEDAHWLQVFDPEALVGSAFHLEAGRLSASPDPSAPARHRQPNWRHRDGHGPSCADAEWHDSFSVGGSFNQLHDLRLCGSYGAVIWGRRPRARTARS